jgi:integrative and conjugative element protein (TIGR02256 family)
MPEVRALRRDFPVLLHENHAAPGEPTWLCLYFEPWPAIRRTWTPQRFLARVQWWLSESANGTLHPADQPPEQLYFESLITLVLPSDFEQHIASKDQALALELRSSREESRWVLNAVFTPLAEYKKREATHYACVVLTLPAIPHGPIEHFPNTLGDVHDQLAKREAPIAEALFTEIQRIAEGIGLPTVAGQKTFLVLNIPIFNPAGGAQRLERRGFIINTALGELGVMAGVLMQMKGKYVKAVTLGGLQLLPDWRKAKVAPLEIVEAFTDGQARLYSGVKNLGPEGVLAGVGALGSALADIWAREGWGRWTYIDPEPLLPHNLARHRGYEHQVGMSKVDVVRQLEAAVYPRHEVRLALRVAANEFEAPELNESLRKAELIVDTTTTIEVPRDLALRNDIPRCLSAFLTPSGSDSILLLEDDARTMRLDVLEAQYYRLVINASWGEKHLEGHQGALRVGAGCRDVTNVISGELVLLHAALLARQIRLRSASPEALIQVWRCNTDTGAVDTTAFGVTPPIFSYLDNLQLVWDVGLRTKIRTMRQEGLPGETGGVLLGYFDLKNSRVYVVDALPAPPDSYRSKSEFARGVEGLEVKVQAAKSRTGNIVDYIGEWHSHPRGVRAIPSGLDIRLLVHLAVMLRQDGLPALMLIVGDSEEQWIMGSVRD